ncbi:MAG: hypothetical protein IBJ12_02335 [Sphingomonadaceae bacterium]|nr:hypothetical protein [Sphingomonadaceae bacterium]
MNQRRLFIVAIVFSATQPVYGQDADTSVQRIDRRIDMLDRIEDPEPAMVVGLDGGAPPKPKEFEISLTLPFTFNSNVENAGTGRKQAFHALPSMQIDWRKSSGVVRPFARLYADADFYTRHSENDGSTTLARVGVKIVEPKLGNTAPYLHYTPALVYDKFFGERLVTLHNFTAGVTTKFDLKSAALTIDVHAVRREATLKTIEQNRFGTTLKLSGDINERLSWAIDQTVQARFYTGGASDGRDDVNFVTNAGLSWAIADNGGFDFGISFERNDSSRVGKSYSTWDIGPTVGFGWKF